MQLRFQDVPYGGYQLLMQLYFVKFVCQDERIGILKGHVLVGFFGSSNVMILTLDKRRILTNIPKQSNYITRMPFSQRPHLPLDDRKALTIRP